MDALQVHGSVCHVNHEAKENELAWLSPYKLAEMSDEDLIGLDNDLVIAVGGDLRIARI